jgi:hypothetical protein
MRYKVLWFKWFNPTLFIAARLTVLKEMLPRRGRQMRARKMAAATRGDFQF